MYKAIEKQQPIMEKYADELVSSGVVTKDDYKVCKDRVYSILDIDIHKLHIYIYTLVFISLYIHFKKMDEF
jgi:2-oxoglutarate dehydrogenase complex dehydrogenase (E1) component-like enzyme